MRRDDADSSLQYVLYGKFTNMQHHPFGSIWKVQFPEYCTQPTKSSACSFGMTICVNQSQSMLMKSQKNLSKADYISIVFSIPHWFCSGLKNAVDIS